MTRSQADQPAASATEEASPFRVLLVCWANHCRSPLAEHLMRAAMPKELGWQASSAGISAMTGRPIHERAARELTRRGIDSTAFRSRPLTPELVDQADLVLTAEAAHRSAVVRMVPSATGRTFTVLQFAGLCSRVSALPEQDGGLGAALLRQALAARGAGLVDVVDIADPVGRRALAFRRCATTIDKAIGQILRPVLRTSG